MNPGPHDRGFDLSLLDRCFGGGVPAVMTTIAVDGTPNVTYLSRAHRVDEERIALSNQFMSKTSRNLASNPAASLLLLDPTTVADYRLRLRIRTDRASGPRVRTPARRHRCDRGPHAHGSRLPPAGGCGLPRPVGRTHERPRPVRPRPRGRRPGTGTSWGRWPNSRPGWVDRMTSTSSSTPCSMDWSACSASPTSTCCSSTSQAERSSRSRAGGSMPSRSAPRSSSAKVWSAWSPRGRPARIGDLNQVAKYTERVRQEFAAEGVESERAFPMPGLPGAKSRIAVPAMALGQVVGVLVADRLESVAFTETDEQVLGVVASMLASAIEHARSVVVDDDAAPIRAAPVTPRRRRIGGVADRRPLLRGGRQRVPRRRLPHQGCGGPDLVQAVREHIDTGRVDFTNRELRLDPALELPEVKDNLESRLVLLKRRLDEREAPIRVERTGRGLFRLHVSTPLRIEITRRMTRPRRPRRNRTRRRGMP